MSKEINVLLNLYELELLLKCLKKANAVDSYDIKSFVTLNYDVKSKLEDMINIVDDYLGEYGFDKCYEPNKLGLELESLKDKFISALQNFNDKKIVE